MADRRGRPEGSPSRWWYLLPILFNIIGGIIGYFAVRHRDRKLAENLLIAGLVMFVLWWIVSFAIAAFVSAWLSSVVTDSKSKFSLIDISDASCSGGSIITVVRNLGPSRIALSELQFYVDNMPVQSCPGELQAGSSVSCALAIPSGSSLISTHEVLVVGPVNTADESVLCIS